MIEHLQRGAEGTELLSGFLRTAVVGLKISGQIKPLANCEPGQQSLREQESNSEEEESEADEEEEPQSEEDGSENEEEPSETEVPEVPENMELA